MVDYLLRIEHKKRKLFRTKILNPEQISLLKNKLVQKILNELSKCPQCPLDLARTLKVHEQKIYYHIRNLEKAGIITLLRYEPRTGGLAKVYSLSSSAFATIINQSDFEEFESKSIIPQPKFLEPFIKNGRMNSIIVVGSPDPHGRFGYQAMDASVAIDLALFLGSFLTEIPEPNYKLDTQISSYQLKKNLILIGGPKTNVIIDKLNKKMPLFFDEKHDWNIISKKTKKRYREDVAGIIIKMNNPFNKKSKILILAGKRFRGTRGAVIGLIKHPEILEKDNVAKVIRAIDRDGDNFVDDVEFLE